MTICSHGMNTQILDAILFKKLMDYAEENNIILNSIDGDRNLNPLELSEINEVLLTLSINVVASIKLTVTFKGAKKMC